MWLIAGKTLEKSLSPDPADTIMVEFKLSLLYCSRFTRLPTTWRLRFAQARSHSCLPTPTGGGLQLVAA
jgi:hypothetical protein